MKRIFTDILLFLSIFLFPAWLAALLSYAGVFLFRSFYEAILIGLSIDLIYGVRAGVFLGNRFWYATGAIIVIIVSVFIKRRVKMYG